MSQTPKAPAAGPPMNASASFQIRFDLCKICAFLPHLGAVVA